jgi:hypothetical protein
MTDNLKIINPLKENNWNDLVKNYSDCSFFHSTNWANVLRESYNYFPFYFVTYTSEGEVRSIIPFMEISSFLTGKRGVSLPFSDYCEPLCDNNFDDLFSEIKNYAAANKWKTIEFRGGNKFFPQVEPSSFYYHHVLDLQPGEEKIFSNFSSNNKRNIKKALRENVKIEMLTSLEATDQFYQLNCMTRKKHGLPPQPYYFFKNIFKNVFSQNLGFIILASYNKKVIAGAVYFHFGKKALYKFGASDMNYQHLRANNLIMWEAIKHFAEKGFTEFSFGKTEPDNAGLRQFKLGWGTQEEKIFTYKYNLSDKRFIENPDQTSGVHTKIFSKLPIPVLKLVGTLTYRHIG